MRFRRNIERIGEIMAYELSKELHYKAVEIQTPLGIKNTTKLLINWLFVLFYVLDFQCTGFLNYFDAAQKFISASRHHPNNDDYFEILLNTAIADFNGTNIYYW
jgi:uracil phosphoribosyltransferase